MGYDIKEPLLIIPMKALRILIPIIVAGLHLLPSSLPAVVLNEVSPTENKVEIYNDGSIATNLTDYYFCSRIRYVRLGDSTNISVESGSLSLQPGEYVVLHITNTTYDILDSGADLGLYRNNTNFGDSNNMADFLQWGDSGNPTGRQSEAESAGIWTAGTYVAIPGNGESLIRGESGTGASLWSVTATPTFGSANTATDGGAGGDISVQGWAYLNSYPYVYSNDEQGWTYYQPTEEGLWIYSFTHQSWSLRQQTGLVVFTDVEPAGSSNGDSSGTGDTSGGDGSSGGGGTTVEEPYQDP